MPDSSPTVARGHCYCGAVHYTLTLPEGAAPLFRLYCHCESCRRAHAAPLYQVACVDSDWLQIDDVDDALQEFQKPGANLMRTFCGQCGTRMFNRFPGWRPDGRTPVAFFPDTLVAADRRSLPAALQAERHNAADECVLDLQLLSRLDAG